MADQNLREDKWSEAKVVVNNAENNDLKRNKNTNK